LRRRGKIISVGLGEAPENHYVNNIVSATPWSSSLEKEREKKRGK